MTEIQIEVLTSLQTQLTAAKKMQENRRGVMCDSGWVVCNEGVYIKYTFGDRGLVLSAKPCGVTSATKMSEVNAKHLAKETKNGFGNSASALHINDALRKEIRDLEALIATITKK